MKYERLTDRETAEMLKNTEGGSWDSDNEEAQRYIKLAEYEDLEEQGLMLRLPCKVGDKFWYISSKLEIIAEAVFELSTNGKIWGVYDSMSNWHLVKNIFFTYAEAEKKLAKLKGGKR